MKALKNDSTIYTQNIVSAIHNCYKNNHAPTNTELMKLYSFVGQCICEQGEKAFVVHLAQNSRAGHLRQTVSRFAQSAYPVVSSGRK